MDSLLLTLLATASLVGAAPTTRSFQSQDVRLVPRGTDLASNHHVVMLDPSAPDVTDVLSQLNLSVENTGYVYGNSEFKGFSAALSKEQLSALNSLPGVLSIGLDKKVYALTQRADAPWGLQRISSSHKVSGNASALTYTYTYENAVLGDGVDIYILDTGIRTTHTAFGGRAKFGWSAFGDDGRDGYGHGTHVSGTAAGAVYGVSSNANLIAVKVLDDYGGGSTSGVMAGIDYILQQHLARSNETGFVASVMSASLGMWNGREEGVLDTALKSALLTGRFHAVIAAGNSQADACEFSPAKIGGSNSTALTVGSIGADDTISYFSNTGSCVDIYAPGEQTVSAYNIDDNSTYEMRGTSMATPHVTGVVAYWAAKRPDLARDPAAMKAFLGEIALKNIVTGTTVEGDKKVLLNNGQVA